MPPLRKSASPFGAPIAAPGLAATCPCAAAWLPQLSGNPGVVNLTLLENYFAISSTPLAAAAGGGAGAFTADLTGLNTNGTVLSQSLAAPAPEVLSVTGMNDTNASAVAATVQVGPRRGAGGMAAVAGCPAGASAVHRHSACQCRRCAPSP